MDENNEHVGHDVEVQRENFLDTIDNMFARSEVVVVRGASGIGKTVLLQQYAHRVKQACIRLFIRPLSSFAYEPQSLLSQLYEQAADLAEQPLRSAAEPEDLALLRETFIALDRRARRKKFLVYFVIDGLDDIPEADVEMRNACLDALPFGMNMFRFLLSGDGLTLAKQKAKDLPLIPFTIDDSHRYLRDLVSDREASDEIHRTCLGIPARLASVRRILLSGTLQTATLLKTLPSSVPDLFEMEWHSASTSDELVTDILSIMAFDRQEHSIEWLASVLAVGAAEIAGRLSQLGFVLVQNNCASYISEPFRSFAQQKLYACQSRAQELILRYLLRNPTSPETLNLAPTYMEQTQRYRELLDFLTPNHFAAILEHNHSLLPLRQKAELGMRTANRLKRDGDLIRFALQLSTANDMASPASWKAEIEARMALDDVDSARRIAQSAILSEVRLRSLATVVKMMTLQKKFVDPAILDEIERLYPEVAADYEGSDADDLASDLLFVRPELAIQLIENAVHKRPGRREWADWTLARLSLQATFADELRGEPAFLGTPAAVEAKISSPRAQEFARSASLLFSQYSAAEIIARVEKMQDPRDRVGMLRHWLIRNSKKEDAAEISEYALRATIAASEITPSAQVLSDLAAPLPFLATDVARRLVAMFDSQRGSAEKLGPTQSFVGFCINLARGEMLYSPEGARARLLELYLHVSYQSDLSTKAACVALLANAMNIIDPDKELEKKEQLHGLVTNDLENLVNQLLDFTADHVAATKEVIRILARGRRDLALTIALRLNTQERRDQALLFFTKSVCSLEMDERAVLEALVALDRIVDPSVWDEAALAVLTSNLDGEREVPLATQTMERLTSLVSKISSMEQQCRAGTIVYCQLCRSNVPASVKEAALQEVKRTWAHIESGWERVAIGFGVARKMSKDDPAGGRWFLAEADAYRREIGITSNTTSAAWFNCINLAVRAFSGLFHKHIDTEADIDRLERLIERVPARGEQAAIWSDVAFRMSLAGRTDDCARIVRKHVTPRLNTLWEDNRSYVAGVLCFCLPCIYVSHRQNALDWLKKVPAYSRSIGCRQLFFALFHRFEPTDPIDHRSAIPPTIGYEEAVEIVAVIELMDVDQDIAYSIEKLTKAVGEKKNRLSFTRQQKAELGRVLKELVGKKLPNPKQIKHEGYKVLSLASIQAMIGQPLREWQSIIDAARAIPNISDRIYVLADVAAKLPSDAATSPALLLEEALTLVSQVPRPTEQAGRYRAIFNSATECLEHALAKRAIIRSMEVALLASDDDIEAERKRIVDDAYRVDPDLAEILVAIGDSDPARAKARHEVEKELSRLKRRRDRVNESEKAGSNTTWDEELGSQAWQMLGALNAGSIAGLNKQLARTWIAAAANAPVRDAFPVFAFVLEGLIRHYAKTPEASVTLRPVFDGMLQAVELAVRIGTQTTSRLPSIEKEPKDLVTSILVRAGEKDRAIKFIEQWLRSCPGDLLKICDPYFGPEDLETIMLIRQVSPGCKVAILTSAEHQNKNRNGLNEGYEPSFRVKWRAMISDGDAPETEIVIAGMLPDGRLPIHDRWWIMGDSGLRIGTSLNGLGALRESEISILAAHEVPAREAEVDRFLSSRIREHMGRRLQYTLFTL